jgi:hypothetical protein
LLPSQSSGLLDAVAMALPQQANDIVEPVNNDGKQISDVTSQDTYIERFQLGDCGILPSEHDIASIFMRKLNLGCDDDRINYAIHTTDAL